MPLVRAGDLVTWASTLPADELVAIGDTSEWEDDSSAMVVEPVTDVAQLRYLYRWDDEPDIGFISDDSVMYVSKDGVYCRETDPDACEWLGTPIWRVGR